MTQTHHIINQLWALGTAEKATFLPKFFKTWKGEYGEGDKFLGVVVHDTRKIAKAHKNLPLFEVEQLLHSQRHEVRLCALLILIEQTKKTEVSDEIIDLYLRNTAFINNRDLVDLSAPEIVGKYYFDKDRSILFQLAKSDLLRDRRIAVLASFYFIKHGQHEDTFRLAEILLHDKEDLMQKAVGRMLREVGKRIDTQLLLSFLDEHSVHMPRTMLRYAIERLPEAQRKEYLNRK